MKRNTIRSVVVISAAAVLPALGATRGAPSCSSADVQNAINAAAPGDVVTVPAGSCTWTSTVRLNAKGITLQGAGINQTNITDNGSGGAALDVTGASPTNFVNVTGFTFIKGTDHTNGIVHIAGNQDSIGFRFHHNRILQASSGSRGIKVEGVFGLIDHVTFDVTASAGSVQSVSVFGSPDGTDGGFTPWTRPLTLGTNKAVYIEDSTFTYSNQNEDSVDAYGGARLVIRNSTFNNISVGFHGTDSGDRRSVFSYEIYNNRFANNSSNRLRAATVRGGTGVVFNNTYSSTQGWNGVTLLVYRACPPLDSSRWQTCDGTNWKLGSTDFSSEASRTASTTGTVKFCSIARDTVCTSDAACGPSGGTCSTYFDGSGQGGYACRDQPGRTHDQVASPIYVWNNAGMLAGTYDGGVACGTGIATYLQAGRDYINNTPRPGYVAYVYPHPLSTGGSPTTPPPAAPANLRIVR